MSESEFHYVRTTGVDGGVDAVDGRAIGVDLDTILKDGLPPFKVALEIIAALCEILDISDQDGETHGDVHPGCIFLDDTGAISIEGFGMDRAETMAPEGEPVGPLTDLYGLGYVAYRMLATRDLADLPSEPDDHDDAVIDAVVALPWGDMPEEWVGDIQWFLAKLMSFEPEERPTAVDAWRTFIAFAEEAEGATLVDWSPDAIEGGGDRRDAAMAVRPAAEEGEDLGGPVVSSGPLAKGQISFGGGAAKGGQATAFWSKEQMKAALEADEEEEDEAPAFKPSVGGGAATSFWTRDQMEAMARGDASAPRPKRKEGGAKPRAAAPPPAPRPPPAAPPPPAAAPPPAAPPPMAAPPVAPPPAAPPPMAGGPIAAAPGMASAGAAMATPAAPPPQIPYEDEEESAGGGMKIAMIGGIVAVLVLLCLGVGVIGGVAVMFMGDGEESSSSSSSSTTTEEEKDDEPAEKQDTAVQEVAKPEPKPEPKPEVKPEPKPTPKPTTRRTTPTTRRTTSSSRSTTAAPAGPTRVVFTVPGTGSVRCGDGTNKSADGRASITFKTVPSDGITCTFYSADSKPVCAGFVMPGNRKCSCDANSAEISCN